jgi:hypothetical protein
MALLPYILHGFETSSVIPNIDRGRVFENSVLGREFGTKREKVTGT